MRMRILLVIFFFLFLSGCASDGEKKEIVQKTETAELASGESSSNRSKETLEGLLKEVPVDAQLEESCGELKVELTTAYLEADNSRPSVVGFCHNDGMVDLEQETAYIAIATYDEANKIWQVDMIEHEFVYHPSRIAGVIQLADNSERVVLELYEDPATFGGTSAVVVSSADQKLKIERVNSTVTQQGSFRTEGNKIIIEDEHTAETYTYSNDTVTHTTGIKEMETNADIVITYNKVNDSPLFGSLESGEILEVSPGDIVSFQPEKPLSLVNFQIRTSMEQVPDTPDTFVVEESDIGETIEIGEYPYDDMIVYYIGDPNIFTSKKYLNDLERGIMPGSKVQLTHPNSEIKNILKDEFLINEYGASGAKHLQYDQYIYAIPFLEEEGDIIYSVIRVLPYGTNITGDDFIKGWGKPTNIYADMDSLEESLIMRYEFEGGHYVHIYLSGATTDTRAISIHLY